MVIIYNFLKIFKIPESILVFFSGIFVSASINIFTSIVPDASSTLRWNFIVSAVFMLICSILLMIWACCVKPYQEQFAKETKENRQAINGWANVLSKKAGSIKLSIIFVVTIVFIGLGIGFLFI